jgi:hypothetical protein
MANSTISGPITGTRFPCHRECHDAWLEAVPTLSRQTARQTTTSGKHISVIVNPLSAPGIGNLSFAGGHFGFTVNGQSGPDYGIEISTNLTQWSDLFTTNSPVLPFVRTDTNSAASQRFYRVKLGPPLP